MPKLKFNEKSGDKVVIVPVRVNCQMDRLLKNYVHDKRQNKYTDKGPFIRDAIKDKLRECFQNPGMEGYAAEYATWEAAEIMRKSETRQKNCDDLMSVTERRVNSLLEIGADKEIIRLLEEARVKLDAMPDDFWSRRVRKLWNNRFGQWVFLQTPDDDRINVRPSAAELEEEKC